MLRNNKGKMIIVIFLLIVVILIIALVFVLTNKKEEQEKNNYQIDTNEGSSTENEYKEEKEKMVDFWINEYELPDITKEFSLNLFDNIAGVPIDLTRLENGNYTFNYTISKYDIVEPGEYSVKKLDEIKGKRFGSTKDISVKTKEGEKLFDIVLKDNSNNEEITYYDSIKNNWWYIPLKPEKILGEAVKEVHKYDGDIILEKIIEILGRPTHINAWFGDTDLKVDEEGIGSVIYDIVYDYNGFKIVLSVNEIVNNTTIGRWVSLNGFYYYTNESYEAQIKDIQRNYTITDILPIL